MRAFYGEKVGLYFRFLIYYTTCMSVLMLPGTRVRSSGLARWASASGLGRAFGGGGPASTQAGTVHCVCIVQEWLYLSIST